MPLTRSGSVKLKGTDSNSYVRFAWELSVLNTKSNTPHRALLLTVFKTPPWKTGEHSAVSTTARAPGVAGGSCRRMLLCPSLPSPRSGLLTVGWGRSFLTCRAARTEPMSSSASLQRRSPLLDTLYKWPLGPLRGRFYSINILDFFFLWDLQQFEKTQTNHIPQKHWNKSGMLYAWNL